ncbi:DEAD/DEAH box helicase, partial [Patescibacteria group bacterium]|nr:DEAD/DEAH box helicase [Patescibacteria group bacterium]
DQCYPEGVESPKLDSLLKTSLYSYQKGAVLKAVKAGRCLLADDMGLGKTIQAIGAAEILARELGITSVLIICPTSLKYQWKNEIEKFSSRSALVIEGRPDERKLQYQNRAFFKIISYNVVLNDLQAIQTSGFDLVILDEAQRIKNWKTKTALYVKQITSPYALVLTGTPLENRLEELHSIVEFVDRYRLGPLFRFLANHQIADDNERVIGYTKLHNISKTIAPILVRRTKKQVLDQLPGRIDKNIYVETTQEQQVIHQEHYETVSRLVNKWRRQKFLSEKERQILMISLNCMRMVANSTFILDQKTRHDTKIDELKIILKEVFEGSEEKVVIFSQWERMTRLIAKELQEWPVGFQYLHGGIPSPKRKDLLKNFHEDSNNLVFLSTDAGGVGLNLQCASVVINMDCPWNPAVLEQRVARVHRLGQKRPVTVINFISRNTIEENLLRLIGFKKSLFDGVLDHGENQVFMGEGKLKQFMKTVGEVTDDVVKQPEKKPSVLPPTTSQVQQTRAMQELFATGISFLEKLQLTITSGKADVSAKTTRKDNQTAWVEKDEQTGKMNLKIPLPEPEALNKAVQSLQALMGVLKK